MPFTVSLLLVLVLAPRGLFQELLTYLNFAEKHLLKLVDHSFLAIECQNFVKRSFKVKHLIVAFRSRYKISASEV